MDRKYLPHAPIVYLGNRSPIVFLTVCTKEKKEILATPESYRVLLEAWQLADAWAIGRFVVMRHHIHLFCAPRNDSFELKSWVRFWKSTATRNWPRIKDKPIWQRDFWDTQLRTNHSYDNKWEYVRQNPVRSGFVKVAEDWPYQGELNRLDWHGK